MKYKAVGFDYSGVIVGPPASEIDRQISALLNVSLDSYHKAYFKNNHLLNQGILSRDEFWSKVLTELNRLDKHSEVLNFIQSLDRSKINHDILTLAQQLKSLGYKIGLLSNNTLDGLENMRNIGLMELFDVVAVSTEIGFRKPDPKVFDIFIDRLKVLPQELIFIDDTVKSLSSAKEVGYRPIVYTELSQLKDELSGLGVL